MGKFSLGKIVTTPAALDAIPSNEIDAALVRHKNGDWGDLCAEDIATNENALLHSGRLLSVYGGNHGGHKFWIITEQDRSTTTILLPADY